MTPAQQRVMVAQLLDHFHLTIAEIARLTDWQIQRLYFAAREKDGRIKVPHQPTVAETAPATYESESRALDRLAGWCTPESVAEARTKLKEKYGRSGG